jgi:hypothetical protein
LTAGTWHGILTDETLRIVSRIPAGTVPGMAPLQPDANVVTAHTSIVDLERQDKR